MKCPYKKESACEAFSQQCNQVTVCSFKSLYTDFGFWNRKGEYIEDWQWFESEEL